MTTPNKKLAITKLKYALIEGNAANDAQKELKDKLQAFNFSHLGEYKNKEYLLTYHDQNNRLIAGLFGYCRLGRFYIDILWVDELWRKHGLGTKLLQQAEECACKSAALYIRINTGSFQAPDFYLKHHYHIFAKLPLATSSKEQQYDYYMIKYLPQNM